MIKMNLQFFGGRGGNSGKSLGAGKQVNSDSSSTTFKSTLKNAFSASAGMREYEISKALDSADVGTKIYDGSKTSTDRSGGWTEESTYYEKTSGYGWTLFGDLTNYSSLASNQVAKRIWKKDFSSIKVRS